MEEGLPSPSLHKHYSAGGEILQPRKRGYMRRGAWLAYSLGIVQCEMGCAGSTERIFSSEASSAMIASLRAIIARVQPRAVALSHWPA